MTPDHFAADIMALVTVANARAASIRASFPSSAQLVVSMRAMARALGTSLTIAPEDAAGGILLGGQQ